MREERNYLSDDELEKLIADVEQEPMRRAPEYLERMILKKTEQNAVRWSQFAAYSAKIVAAAAAAIALIITMPEIERQSEIHQQEVEQEERKSVTTSINEATSSFCNQLFEKTNELLFQREEN